MSRATKSINALNSIANRLAQHSDDLELILRSWRTYEDEIIASLNLTEFESERRDEIHDRAKVAKQRIEDLLQLLRMD